jgi:signal peptidase
MTSIRGVTARLGELVLLLAVTSLVAGALMGQPILLSYVETGSMAPTMDPGDGFVAVPSAVAGPVEEGDVVVFRAEEIQGGGLTTHRIVDETPQGYVTKGDANPFTDQDGGEPPVKDPQIVAKVWAVGGGVVVIPHLGDAVLAVRGALQSVQRVAASTLGTRALLGPQGLAYLFFALTALYYLVGEYRDRTGAGGRDRTRDRSRETGLDANLLAGALAVVLVASATAAMVVPAGTQQYGVVSAEFDSPRPTVVPMGESSDVRYPVGNGGVVPVRVFLEPASEGVEVHPAELSVGGRQVVNATVTLHAPPQTGYYRRFVVEHRYLSLLPPDAIRWLYAVHPWAPILAIDALVGVPFYLAALAALGGGRVRPRTRDANRSLRVRVRRLLRGLYQ